MTPLWSVGTTFRVKGEDGLEIWTVAAVSDVEQGVISADSPFGRFLLATVPGRKSKFTQPDGEEVEYEVTDLTLPGDSEELVKRITDLVSRISEGASISPNDEQWLEKRGHFELLAQYRENQFVTTGNATHAVLASKYWRKAGNAELALKATEGIEERDPHVMSMVLTTRGGAFRDAADLAEAETCARNAIRLDPRSYYPYNLMGAILYQDGRPEEGDKYFEKALDLGSPPLNQERAMIGAVKRAGEKERQRVAEYLKLTNPQRYQRLARYFE